MKAVFIEPGSAGTQPVSGTKKLLLANPRGFCAGVVRAIEAVENALHHYGAPVYVRRHIVHNQIVVDRLEKLGAIFVREVSEIPEGSVTILSAHGVAQSVVEEARLRKLHTLDTTCPLVAKVHSEVITHHHKGRRVLLIGHRDHPEIIGTLGQLPDGAIDVVSSVAEVENLSTTADTPVAYAVQTTFSVRDSQAIVDAIMDRFDNVIGPRASDICYATTNRQAAVEEIAAQSDYFLIVGDRMSSNANRLVESARAAGCAQAMLISDASVIPWAELSAARTIGLSAGASTPDEAISGICDALMASGFALEEMDGRSERVSFRAVEMTARPDASGHVATDTTMLSDRAGRIRKDIDDLLNELIPLQSGAAGILSEAMRYAVVGAGKRIRSVLTIATAEIAGASYAQALRVSAAIEAVHAQSLIHDDLPCMDDDDMRRNKPTVHRQYDEATAVLAGDALMALAFEILGDEATHRSASVRMQLVTTLARTIGQSGLAAGQMMDLYPDAQLSAEQLFECERRKTGGLILYSVMAGAMLGKMPVEKRDNLLRYAEKLGMAFQIRDDLLDQIGDAKIVGKRLRKDKDSGRKNAVEILGLDGAQRHMNELAQQCHRELEVFGRKADLLRCLVDYTISRQA